MINHGRMQEMALEGYAWETIYALPDIDGEDEDYVAQALYAKDAGWSE